MGQFARGAKPSPRHKLLAATPHLVLFAPPPQFAAIPKQLSFWDNDTDGDCVMAEEAFAKGAYSVANGLPDLFVPDAEVIRFAKKHGFLNGATLTDVMDAMKGSDGLAVNGTLYHDGGYSGVDFSNETVLQSAIATGPVKIAIDADALPSTAGNQQGWYATSGGRFVNTDHCISICGYGTAAWLYQQLGVPVPIGLPGTIFGYLVFTWSSIGFVTHAWLMGTTTEAWVRNPTTPGQTPGPTPVSTIVPGLVGGTWQSCSKALANAGLVISPATVSDPTARVTGQFPAQGTVVAAGSAVSVTLATPTPSTGTKILVSLPSTAVGSVGTATVQASATDGFATSDVAALLAEKGLDKRPAGK